MPSDAKSAALSAIEQFLHEEARQGRRCLLVVDEAQNLPTEALEELRMLSNFQLGNQALLQIFLLGQPEFRDQLRADPGLEQLRQRVIATHHLDAMQADEMEPYITHRLSKVGWTGRPDFTMEAIAALYAASGGIPRKLNMLMTRVLLMGAVEKVDRIEIGLIRDVLADIDGDASREHASALQTPQPAEEPQPVATMSAEAETRSDAGPLAEVPPVAAAEPPDRDAVEAHEPDVVSDVAPGEAFALPEVPQEAADDDASQAEASDEFREPEQRDEAKLAPQRFFRPGVAPPVFEAVPEAATEFAPSVVGQEDDTDGQVPQSDMAADELAALAHRMDILADRVEDQEATIKRLVAMLLDYVEREDGLTHRRAA